MDIQELTYLSIVLFTAIALIPTLFIYYYPGIMNERLRRSLAKLDQISWGSKARYIVHYREMGLKDAGPFFAFVIMGFVFMTAPLITAILTSWNNVSMLLLLLGWISGTIFSFFFPLFLYVASLAKTSTFLRVADSEFEFWNIKHKRIEMVFKNSWCDINKILVNRLYQGWEAEQLFVYTTNGHVKLMTNWANMLLFLQDLSSRATEPIKKSDQFTQARIEYNISNPDSEARMAARKN